MPVSETGFLLLPSGRAIFNGAYNIKAPSRKAQTGPKPINKAPAVILPASTAAELNKRPISCSNTFMYI